MNRQVLENAIAYIRRELTRIHHELTCADGAQADALLVRRARLTAELERLESIRYTVLPAMASSSEGQPSSSAAVAPRN